MSVENNRGAFYATAVIDGSLKEGVIQIATGAWLDPLDPNADSLVCKHGNVNMVTHDRGTSGQAQGPAAISRLVKVEKFDGEVPSVTAFIPPEIISTT